jgi:hypothetical protein
MAVDAVQLVLTDEETAASDAIEADHYPLSPRVQTRRAILNKIRPEPPREPSDDDKADQVRRHAWAGDDHVPGFRPAQRRNPRLLRLFHPGYRCAARARRRWLKAH